VLLQSCFLANNIIPLIAFPGQCESAVVDNAHRPRAPSNQLHDVWHARWSAYSVLEGTDINPCCGHLWNRWSCQRKFKVSVLLFHRVNICAVFPLLSYKPMIYTLENLVRSVRRNALCHDVFCNTMYLVHFQLCQKILIFLCDFNSLVLNIIQ